jgi:hypothetical protein
VYPPLPDTASAHIAHIEFPESRRPMHFKSIPVTLINGDVIALMIFARSLALLPLPNGCPASR